MISLPLWFQLYYYMIYSNIFVSTVEDSKIGEISGATNQNTKFEGNIKGSNINEINTPEYSHGSEETKDSVDTVSNQSFKTLRPKSDQLIDLDITKTKSTAEFDCSEEGNVVTYTAKPGYGFYVVKEGKSSCNCCGSDKVIWESRFRSQYLNKVVVETAPDKQKTLTIHCVDGTTAVAKKSKDGDFLLQNDDSTKGSKPFHSSPVADAPTAEPSSEQEPTETPEETRDSADSVSQESEGLEHDATAPTEAPTAEPTSEREPTETPEESRGSADIVSQESDDSKPVDSSPVTDTPTTQNAATPKSQESNKPAIPKVKLIDLDIEKTKNTTEFDYSKNNNVVTYTPKAGYGFSKVKIGKGWKFWSSDKVVWETLDGSKHSNKVVVETGSDKQKTLTIHCVDGTTKVYKKVKDGDFLLQNDDSTKGSKPGNSSPVTDTPISEVNLIDLDITKTESTAEFDYAKNGNVATYTPKEGYGFGTIKKGKGSCSCTRSDEIIWEVKDKTQASNKVIASHVDRKIDPDLFCLEIHILDKSTLRYFNSDAPNSPYYKKWVQRYDNVPKESHPSQIKIYTKDETASEAKENDTSKYTVDIFKEGEASKYGYRIKKGVKCTQVKYDNNEVWNDTENKNHKTIDRLIYDPGKNKIILEHNSFIFKTHEIPTEPKQK